MHTEEFLRLEKKIQAKMDENKNQELESLNSICKQVSKRVPRLKDFATGCDVVVFVSGKNSSNGKYLYNISKSENEKTYFVSGKDELQENWFENVEKVGVTGATSTPVWLLEEIAEALKGMEDVS
jgi:4-hydroxy-3-methylbut-2-enyl diphosphate reductase